MSLNSRKKYILDTHRARDPEHTLSLVRPHLKAMGITRVANLTGLDRIGLPTVMVARPNSRSVAVSLGKGLSLSAARASGVMEAIESWHAEQIQVPQQLARYNDLIQRAFVIDIDALPRVTGGRFDPDQAIMWVQGHDLNTQLDCWVPLEMVDTDYTSAPVGGHCAFPRTTNGLASGNTVTEASCHAICEVIERDATTLWHHRENPHRIDVRTIEDDRCQQALNMISHAGLEIGLWDTTSDVGIACFRCVICEPEGKTGHIGIGDGCHPDRAIALLRAVTEAAQTRLTYISGARDDLDPTEFTDQAQIDRSAFVQNLIKETSALQDFSACATYSTDSFDEDLELLLNRLREVGLAQTVVVNLSRSEFDISVVRAIIPGLEAPHDDPDYVPGRRANAVGGARA